MRNLEPSCFDRLSMRVSAPEPRFSMRVLVLRSIHFPYGELVKPREVELIALYW